MSKSALKKELKELTSEQLTEVILQAYDINKAVRAYFDYYATPEPEKLYSKYWKVISKEMGRTRYRDCVARISRIKKAIAEYESFGPGMELVLQLKLDTIEALLVKARWYNFSKPLTSGTAKLAVDIMKGAEKHHIYSEAFNGLTKIIQNRDNGFLSFRKYVVYELSEAGFYMEQPEE
ncbi:MAG: hypothetical protein K2M79_06765 [Muribaculaceae bacterium]|nr:hypothetical protein [Muribaculaceae bacterium]